MKKVLIPERRAGIWLDQEKAYLIYLTGSGKSIIEKIESGVESRIRIPGEVKVSARFGNAFIDDQEKKQRRKNNQLTKYFKEIIKKISDVDFLFLFGPGDTRLNLDHEIKLCRSCKTKVVSNESADKMTEKQLNKKVNQFF